MPSNKIKTMDVLTKQVGEILEYLRVIKDHVARLEQQQPRPRKRQRCEIVSDSDTEEEVPTCEQQAACVSEDGPEADEEGARDCVKTHFDIPVVVVSTKASGSRLYRKLRVAPNQGEGTRRSPRGVCDVHYSKDEPILDEDDLPAGETLKDTVFVGDGPRRGFLNTLSNSVYSVVPRCGLRDYTELKTVFCNATPDAPDFTDKKACVLWCLEQLGANFTFGSTANAESSDEMRHLLLIDPACQRAREVEQPKEGFLCDACNLRRTITHVWDGEINLGRNCAEKVNLMSDVLRLVPRTQNDIDKHGEALFVRLVVLAESFL